MELIEFAKNVKLEIITIIISVVMFFFKNFLPAEMLEIINLSTYFNQDRLNGIAAFFAITIGVYITVIMVLATSEIGISKELLKRKLDRPLIDVIIVGIIENFFSAGISIFVPMNDVSRYILVVFLTISMLSFIKFIILLVTIFKVNLEEMAKGIDAEEQYKNELLTYVEGIFKNQKRH